MGVGYLIGCIIIFHIIIIVAQMFLGPLDNSAAVLSEEALRVRDQALYGAGGKDGEVVVNMDEKVSLFPSHLPHSPQSRMQSRSQMRGCQNHKCRAASLISSDSCDTPQLHCISRDRPCFGSSVFPELPVSQLSCYSYHVTACHSFLCG